MTRGFITVATGDEQYYINAKNLLASYHLYTSNPYPFAIIADRENQYTELFDDVIICPEAKFCYLDKLLLQGHLPYDENICIEPDCLAYSDINDLFDVFENALDFSGFGSVYPITDKEGGWFQYDELPQDIQENVSYVVGFHSGFLYLRNTCLCNKVLNDAKEFAKEYDKYHFKGYYLNPADETVMALSMAINDCKPVPYDKYHFSCYTNTKLKLNMFKGKANRLDGTFVPIVHWGTGYTRTPMYKKQVDQMYVKIDNASVVTLLIANIKNDFHIMGYKVNVARINTMDRLQSVEWLRKIWHFIKGK